MILLNAEISGYVLRLPNSSPMCVFRGSRVKKVLRVILISREFDADTIASSALSCSARVDDALLLPPEALIGYTGLLNSQSVLRHSIDHYLSDFE